MITEAVRCGFGRPRWLVVDLHTYDRWNALPWPLVVCAYCANPAWHHQGVSRQRASSIHDLAKRRLAVGGHR